MPEVVLSASAVLQAAPQIVYAIFTDYHEAHPSVLPRPSFGDLVVEKGGTGAGTVFRVDTQQLFGRKTLRMEASEPQPGRLLVESDLDSDLRTHFLVEPMDGGRGCRVTITTKYTRPGALGWLERALLPTLARSVLNKELRNVEQLARQRAAASASL
jgi:hypothetical protein